MALFLSTQHSTLGLLLLEMSLVLSCSEGLYTVESWASLKNISKSCNSFRQLNSFVNGCEINKCFNVYIAAALSHLSDV